MVNFMKTVALSAAITSASAHTFQVFENTDCTSKEISITVDTVPDADGPCKDFPPKYKTTKFRSVKFSNMNTCRFRFASSTDQCQAKEFANTFDSGAENLCFQIPDNWKSMDVNGCPPVPPGFAKMNIAAKSQMTVQHW